MRWRIGHLSLLIFQAIWLNVVVPGHTRGIVQLPSMTRQVSCPMCCGEEKRGKPIKNPSNCAICQFAAHLMVPPAVDLSLPPLGLLARLWDEPVRERISRRILLPFDGRGPPLA